MIPFWKKTDKHSKPQSAQKRRQNAKPAVPRTAQQSIPMQRMFEDGTCRVKPNYYTRTIQYQDINYQLAQQEDKTAIFEEWCSFLNFFDSSIKFELSFVNMATDSTEFEKSIRIPFQKDGFDDVRAEYSQMLRQQLAKGNNGLTKTKFITFGVEGESMAQVKPRLDHIQNDLLNNFHRLGVQAKPLNGVQRLKLMHDMFNMDGASKFHFDWKDLVKSGLSVKDAIAPTAFAFKNSRTFQMGGIYCAASFLSITASDISDQLLKDFLDMDSSQIVTMHIQSVDQNRAIKTVKRTITELDRSKIEEQKKAIRAGYDIDIIPSDLATYGRDAKALLKELQSQNERMFLVTFLVLNTGRTEQELENNVFQASSIAQKHNCNLCRLDFQQEQGLMSSLPLADCQIEIQRGLTTSSTAIFIPFTTQELYQSGKESLYYGLNALSNNLIMVDRKKLKNPNGLILGTPGSGKSFSAKREITNAFLVTDDDIIICDPEAEYAPLVERLHGQVIHIGPASTQYINPMDINSNYSEEDNPLALKADFILSLCELVVGGKEGLQPVEKTVIDRCVHVVYRKYFENLPVPEAKFETVVVKPSEIQQDMVKSLSERAAEVHSGAVDPSVDNMLKITSDGRKIGLDQRLMNPLTPDDPDSKLNACVDNVLRIWNETKEDNLTQLIFCDMSTPKGDGSFNVYDDIRTKLLAAGVPESEVEFIHNADTEGKKADLFSKVRSGKVRVLLGSTAKMGAGTNVQTLLVAVHHLDVGWRPSDMTQRNGRIIRQGNKNKQVYVHNYVTEGTFDAYLWQTLENKQKFISQIMTSKSPMRSCDDVDEQALSYAEVKALCAGDPRIREKMDLDVQVAKLKVLRSDYQNQKYRLEDKLLKHYPEEIQKAKNRIAALKNDAQIADAHPQDKENFCGMTIKGMVFDEKKAAGERLMLACKEMPNADMMLLGTYRGFELNIRFDSFKNEHQIVLRGELSYPVPLGDDPRGNIVRLDNAIGNFADRIADADAALDSLEQQKQAAEVEIAKPFAQEEELQTKSARLAELDALLNMEHQSSRTEPEAEEKPDARPSVLAALEEKADKVEPVRPFKSYLDKDGDAR